MKKSLVIAFIFLFSFEALSAEMSASISSLANATFPSISGQLITLYQNFETTISEEDIKLLNKNYFETAKEVFSGNYAPNLKAKFAQTVAPFFSIFPSF